MLILGTTVRKLHCGHPTHGLPAELVSVGLLGQLVSEYGETWYACATFRDGQVTLRGLRHDSPGPDEDVREKMFRCAALMNRDIHHGGCWIVVWHDDRMSFMWRDQDGDAVLIAQIDEPWARIRGWSAHEFCTRAEEAFRVSREALRAVDLEPSETIKRAQGEQPRRLVH